jgi:hypothetical protein
MVLVVVEFIFLYSDTRFFCKRLASLSYILRYTSCLIPISLHISRFYSHRYSFFHLCARSILPLNVFKDILVNCQNDTM